jgi:hypothetical protein
MTHSTEAWEPPMQAETAERIAAMRALVCPEPYAAAYERLMLARAAKTDGAALQHTREALPFVRRLPNSLRRLVWLSTFGAAGPRRVRCSRSINDLWEAGIGRSLDGVCAPLGVARLVSMCVELPAEEGAAVLRDIASTEAFSTLLVLAGPEAIAREGVELALSAPSADYDNLEAAAKSLGLTQIAEAAAITRWVLAISSPELPQVGPPSASSTTIVLSLPCLRGIRRRGCRSHGRRIGQHVMNGLRGLSRGSTRKFELGLPQCMRGTSETRPLFAPLITDLLSCAVAELSLHGEFRDGAQLLARSCPLLLNAAYRELHDEAASASHNSDVASDWLESLLGIRPFHDEPTNDLWSPRDDEAETST